MLGWALWVAGCIGPDNPIPMPPVPGDQEQPEVEVPLARTFEVRGRIAGPTPQGRVATHVIAIDTTPKSQDRVITAPEPDGTFRFELLPARPYLLVFADELGTGSAAAIGALQVGAWSALTSGPGGGAVDLGDVTLTPGLATPTLTEEALTASLGFSPELSSYLARTDDLARRYTNPDVDNDGELDLLAGRIYAIDVYLVCGLELGPARPLLVDDVLDAWPDLDLLAARLGPSSLYATWDRAFDGTKYVDPTAEQPVILAGGTFDATVADGADVDRPTAFGGIEYDVYTGWGPTWELQAGLELAGARGSPARLEWGLTAVGARLVFTDVSPRSQLDYETDGLLLPLVRVDTAGGVVSGVTWAWKRATPAGWVDATDEELTQRVVLDKASVGVALRSGAMLSFLVGSGANGSTAVDDPSVTLVELPPEQATAVAASDVCRVSPSYNERSGVRVYFPGAQPPPNSGCP